MVFIEVIIFRWIVMKLFICRILGVLYFIILVILLIWAIATLPLIFIIIIIHDEPVWVIQFIYEITLLQYEGTNTAVMGPII